MNKKIIVAPMPGKILDIQVKEGDLVGRGQVLLILEAMKMQNEIMAVENGVIKNISVTVGQNVNTGITMIEME